MTLKEIKKQVEQATGISDIAHKTRKIEYVVARGIYIDLAYRFTTQSYEKIGKAINRHHATVLHSLETFKDLLNHESTYKQAYKELHAHFREQLRQPDYKSKIEDWVNQIPERKHKKVLEQLEALEY